MTNRGNDSGTARAVPVVVEPTSHVHKAVVRQGMTRLVEGFRP